jgi:hypothetical protein
MWLAITAPSKAATSNARSDLLRQSPIAINVSLGNAASQLPHPQGDGAWNSQVPTKN